MLRVLHVEDDQDVLEISALAFEVSGDIALRQCSSGRAAIAVLGEEAFDVVLLDVMMVGLDGPETLKQIRHTKHGADVPTIFVTGRARASEVRNLMAQGAVGVITKPFDPLTLASEIREILAAHQKTA